MSLRCECEQSIDVQQDSCTQDISVSYEGIRASVERVEDGVILTVTDELGPHSAKIKDGRSSLYTSLRRISNYLYEITFENVPPIKTSNIVPTACSSFVRNGKLYRNLDLYYDQTPTFKVIGPGFEGNAIDNRLTITDRFDEDLLSQLPYKLVDGKNQNGIKMSVHVLFNDWDWRGSGSVPLTALPFYILQNVQGMETIETDISSILSDIYSSGESDYLIQILVTDGETTYIVSPPMNESGPYQLIDATLNPKLTNFRWVSAPIVSREELQDRPTGVERWNSIDIHTELSDLRFTKCYETPDRLSEFIGIDETTKFSSDEELLAIYNRARSLYLDRKRDGSTWQTVHSIVYGGNGVEHFWIQENWNRDYSESTGDVSWDDVNSKPFETLGNTLKSVDGVLDVNIYETTNPQGGLTLIVGR